MISGGRPSSNMHADRSRSNLGAGALSTRQRRPTPLAPSGVGGRLYGSSFTRLVPGAEIGLLAVRYSVRAAMSSPPPVRWVPDLSANSGSTPSVTAAAHTPSAERFASIYHGLMQILLSMAMTLAMTPSVPATATMLAVVEERVYVESTVDSDHNGRPDRVAIELPAPVAPPTCRWSSSIVHIGARSTMRPTTT